MSSSTFFHKPELALRRAMELEGINQDEAALGILHDVLSSRRHRTWSPAFEEIMIAYLDLCLKMNKAREAKDGLHQYRNLSQSQAPGSLERVIRHLMEKAEQKCSQAKAFVDAENAAASGGSGAAAAAAAATADSSEAVGDDDEEGGFGASPQAILLSTMSTDPAKTQRDSTVLLPSLKFLWETYRAVLDILRSNSKLEHVYHAAAQNALSFCRIYKRRMEFRHLCDMLRMHLGNLRQYGSLLDPTTASADDSKSNSKVRGWEGWTSDSIEMHLQTRFAQLKTASVLHRYTEGFRTVEDIYHILQISHARRKANPDAPPPKAKLMATYYEKLTTLFWVSENYLFHAFAWYKYYTLCREFNRGMSEEMKSMQASAVLLAALCIPQKTSPGAAAGAGGGAAGADDKQQHGIASTVEDDIVKQKMARMALLLGFHTRNPTREALLTEIRSKNMLEQVPPYLKQLYVLLEKTSDPLIMVEKVRPLLEKLKQEVGATTSTDTEDDDVHDSTLGRYVKPLTSVLLLKIIVNLSTAYHTVSMDHLRKLTSGLGMTFEQVEKSLVHFTLSKTLSVRIDHRAGCLRFGDATLEADAMRTQLTVLSKQLEAVSHILQPPNMSPDLQRREETYKDVRSKMDAEHKAILERKMIIEKSKEEDERKAQEKDREILKQKALADAKRKEDEEKRMKEEQANREREKMIRIQKDLDNQEKKRILKALGKNLEEYTDDQLEALDIDALQKEHREKQAKKRDEAERKTRETAKKLDYFVRAVRIEELPLIKKKYDQKTSKDRERYEQEREEKLKKARGQWEADVKEKEILEKYSVFEWFKEFEEAAMHGRRRKHKMLCEEAEQKAEIEAEKGKIQRARKRKEDEAKRLAAEEARLQEEEERLRAEEEQRKKEEARREREAKEEERRAAEVRRMEEERRRKDEQDAAAAAPPAPAQQQRKGTYVPPSKRGLGGPGGGGSGPSEDRSSRYPGGGRYEGRSRMGGDDSLGGPRPGGAGMGERWRGGPGEDRGARGGFGDRGGDDRRGGGGGSFNDDRRGGYEDRRGGGGGGGFEDRRGGGGDRRFDDRRGGGGGGMGDRGGGGDRSDGRGGGPRDDRGSGGPRDDRGGGGATNSRWR